MEDFDDARFARGPAHLDDRSTHRGPTGSDSARGVHSSAPEPTAALEVLRKDDDRAESLLVQQGREGLVRVRALTEPGMEGVRAEMQLLAALEVAGLRAAPSVVSIEDDGYRREIAPPRARPPGRHAGQAGSPATGERAALGRARDQLDGLIDGLHERGWVLAAPPGQGLGIRTDGSVVLRDLRGLHPGSGSAARQADRRWVDSVLQDQERTLRRRLHAPHELVPEHGTELPDRPSALGDVTATTPPAAYDAGPVSLEAEHTTTDDNDNDSTHVTHAPMPAPRLSRARSRRHDERTLRSRPRPRRVITAVRTLLAEQRSRRTAALAAGCVLVAGAVIGIGSWQLLSPGGSPAEPGPTDLPAAAAPQEDLPPEISDAWALATELAGTRHAYVTGLSSEPAAAPGSAALAADDEIRTAYADLVVDGGGPVVHAATLIDGPTQDGTAVLQVEASTEEYQVIEADGGTRTVPATGSGVLELTLRWDGARWRVESTLTVEPATGT